MGQCLCREQANRDDNADAGRSGGESSTAVIPVAAGESGSFSSSRVLAARAGHHGEPLPLNQHQRLYTLGIDVRDLIIETLNVIRTLVNK